MADIPNTPADLKRLNDEYEVNPYESERVLKALEVVCPLDGSCNPADIQALAERCIYQLRLGYEKALDQRDGSEPEEFIRYCKAMIPTLQGAEALVERSHFIDHSKL